MEKLVHGSLQRRAIAPRRAQPHQAWRSTLRRGALASLGALLLAGCGSGEPAERSADRPSSNEGTLTFYTSIAEKDLAVLLEPFERLHGVRVNVWRSGTDKVLQRTLAEASSGRHDADVIHFGSPEMEALAREDVLEPISSPAHKDLRPGSVPSHRRWAATMLSVWVQAYNTKLVTKAELPRTYQDLLDPKWRGKLGIESKDQDWFASVADVLGGREPGLDFFRQLARGGLSVRVGHSLLTNLVVSGEVPLALTVYSYMPEQAKKRGAPIDWFALEPAIARSNAVGVARQAPHPVAARLFYDYLLGEEAQRAFVSMDYVPSNARVPSPLEGIRILQTDPVRTLDEAALWTDLFESTIVAKTER